MIVLVAYSTNTILVEEDSLTAFTPRKLHYARDMNAEARDMIDRIFQLHFYALYLIAIGNRKYGESFGLIV